MSNTIKIYSNYTQTPVSVSNTGSVNLEEIKSALVTAGADASSLNDSKFVVRQGKLELGYAESLVPAGDQIIMVSPAKTKAGGIMENIEETVENLQETVSDLQEEIIILRQEFNQAISILQNFNPELSAEDRAIMAELKHL